jgi:hypothetical protein
MSESAQQSKPSSSVGRIFAGITLMTGWALVHVVLFYLFFASGAIIDVLLSVVKSIMFPGAVSTAAGAHKIFGWAGFLQAGLISAGAAGVPAGLAIFLRNRRKMLWRAFWILLIVGIILEILAIYVLVTNTFSVPS